MAKSAFVGIDTALSMKELVEKMHDVMRHINSLVLRHAAVTDPLGRADLERQIAEKFSILQSFTMKFGKAFLDRIERNSLYINKLLSNMDIQTLASRWPTPIKALDDYGRKSDDTIQMFRNDMWEEMKRVYALRRYASGTKSSESSNMAAAKRNIREKASALAKIIEARRKEAAKMQQQRQQSARPSNIISLQDWKNNKAQQKKAA